jgi:Ulp1 family protease
MHKFIKKQTSGSEKIYIESLRILPEKERWINDQFVNYYLELIEKFVSNNDTGTLKSMVHAECSFLRHIKKTKGKGLEKQYARKVSKWNVMEKDLLLIPVCQYRH